MEKQDKIRTVSLNNETFIHEEDAKKMYATIPVKPGKPVVEVGQTVIIRGIPFYYIGRITYVDDKRLVLENACWLADSGRWSEALQTGDINECEKYPDPVELRTDLCCDITLWKNPLPETK